MQRLLLIILSSFFLLISCHKSAPEGILSEKKMVDLMAEVHLMDGYFNTLPIDSSRKLVDGMYSNVFAQYGIDSAGFSRNLSYYLGNPTLSKKIYAQINQKLTGMDRGYRVADSVRNAQVADSIHAVQRYTKLRDEAHELMLNVHLDTIPLDYKMYRTRFMQDAGFSFPIFQGESIPVNGPVPLPTSGVQQPPVMPEGPIEEKQLPTARPIVEGEQLKPVKELQRLP
ncbi:DUF4296 domain-containing protein [Sphingobacterium oryzagri]|uniref:DUF4296 domain-containing protein n=1 Tax=Sphingobacterium oryzagri TaxID=3025669 RepID=A0ABY7WBF9_9SPHI|nr:DUF4296 domain-containing protein [Sphingobacterium sp. KACC 22765]WDF66997.1 DUF4296 domain-containing protein [Sphingobacterium sp. KACC 22765]